MNSPVPNELGTILRETKGLERTFLVGGGVRDWYLGVPREDLDVEVYGLDFPRLQQALSRWGRTDLVGKTFGVIKLTVPSGRVYDFSIPRRDIKIRPGHRGFEIVYDPQMQPREAALRRDFTINALMYDPRRNLLLDYVGGLPDAQGRVLRHTSAAFVEDPLRVLRGMQLTARFDLTPAAETIALCRSIKAGFTELAGERVRDEWLKWAQKSTTPSKGLRFLADTEWIEHFPEVAALCGTPQDPDWHPEGDVFIHTCHACDALVRLPDWQKADPVSRAVYSLAILAHDFGKPATTTTAWKHGRLRIVSPGHDEFGGGLAKVFLQRLHMPRGIQERVVPLVTNHLAHLQADTDRAVRRLAQRLMPETIPGLVLVMLADHFGRPPAPPQGAEAIERLLAKAKELDVQDQAPHPILQGRDLIALGMKPGKAIGEIVRAAYEAQIDGQFKSRSEALEWLLQHSPKPLPDAVREKFRS